MGRFDRRNSMKMRRRKAQAAKKARAHRRADERKARLASSKKPAKKSAG
jgi:hypothetical protein